MIDKGIKMKKAILIFALFLLLQACNFPLLQGNTFEDEVATQAAAAFTQTAQYEQSLPTITPQPTTSLPTLTPTSAVDDPKKDLGSAAWQDSIATGNSFGLGTDVTDIEGTNASVWIEEGKLNMYRSGASGGYIWYCAYPNIADFYLEGKFETQNCNGVDEYGLTFRKPDFGDKTGYYFMISCDGKFNLLRWTPNGSALLGDWTESDLINKGPDSINTLGVWAEGKTIKLYINDQFAAEFTDESSLTSGYFGMFSNSKQTAGMTIRLDEIAYWNLP